MSDKPTKDIEPATRWRFLQFLSFGDDRDKAVGPNAKTPRKEPEERKHDHSPVSILAQRHLMRGAQIQHASCHAAAAADYKVTYLLPPEDDDYQYRIKERR